MTQLTNGHPLPPNGYGPPALPGPVYSQPIGPVGGESQLADLWKLLGMVWRRKFSIAFLGLLGAAAGVAYLKYAPPVYKSSAEVLVVPRKPYNLPGSETRYAYDLDDLSMHDAMIRSPLFVGQAVEKHQLDLLPSFAGEEDVADAIVGDLSVDREKEEDRRSPNSVISVSYRSSDPHDSQRVLDAVVASYCEFIQEKGRGKNALANVTAKAEEILKQLQQKEAAYDEFRKNAPGSWQETGGTSIQHERVAEIERRRADIAIARAEAERRLATLRPALKRGIQEKDLLALGVSIPQEPTTNNRAESMQKHLLPLMIEEKVLLEKFGGGHPEVIAIRERIELARQFIATSEQQSNAILNQVGTGENPTVTLARTYLMQQEQKLAELIDSEEALDEMLKHEQVASRQVANAQRTAEGMLADIQRTRLLYDGLLDRARDASISGELLGYDTSVIDPAQEGKKIAPTTKLVLPVATFLGLQLGLAIAFVREASDKRFRNPQEITSRLGAPIIGYVPLSAQINRELKKQRLRMGDEYDASLCVHYLPDSSVAEAYRGIRAALLFQGAANAPRLVQVTSATGETGSSCIAANLAATLAKAGRRVLLVDANLRDPRQHRLLATSSETGLAQILSNTAGQEEAIQQTGIAGLSVLPAGKLPPSAQDLISSDAFTQFLREIQDQYDVVLLDTPALLTATDPVLIARQVDGVILTVGVARETRHQSEQAAEQLHRAGAHILGIVVDGRDSPKTYQSTHRKTLVPV